MLTILPMIFTSITGTCIGWQKDFMAVKKLREFSSFVIYS